MKKMLISCLIVFGLLLSGSLIAQEKRKIDDNDYANQSVPMADGFRAEGKIYVVVAVMVILLSGLVFYVVSTDRKVTALEKKVEEFLDK